MYFVIKKGVNKFKKLPCNFSAWKHAIFVSEKLDRLA